MSQKLWNIGKLLHGSLGANPESRLSLRCTFDSTVLYEQAYQIGMLATGLASPKRLSSTDAMTREILSKREPSLQYILQS